MGISRHQLRNGTLTRMTRGVYVRAGGPAEFEQRARAVLLAAGPRSALSHFSATRVLGGVVPPHSRVHVTTQRTQRIRRTGVTAHRTRGLLPTVAVRGITVTSGLRTFLDLGSLLDLVDLVVLGDSLVKSNAATTTEPIEGTRSWRGPAVAQARVAAGYVHEGVGSPMESRLRMLIVLAGLPEPDADHCLYSQKVNCCTGWIWRMPAVAWASNTTVASMRSRKANGCTTSTVEKISTDPDGAWSSSSGSSCTAIRELFSIELSPRPGSAE